METTTDTDLAQALEAERAAHARAAGGLAAVLALCEAYDRDRRYGSDGPLTTGAIRAAAGASRGPQDSAGVITVPVEGLVASLDFPRGPHPALALEAADGTVVHLVGDQEALDGLLTDLEGLLDTLRG